MIEEHIPEPISGRMTAEDYKRLYPDYKLLPWKSCGCGCKSLGVRLSSAGQFSVYVAGDTEYRLGVDHHGVTGSLGTFGCLAEADKKVREIAKPILKDERKRVREATKALAA